MHLLQRKTGKRVRRVFVPSENVEEPAEVPAPATPRSFKHEELLADLPRQADEADAPEAPHESPSGGISGPDLVRGFEYEKDK